jgi:hypothetical protein
MKCRGQNVPLGQRGIGRDPWQLCHDLTLRSALEIISWRNVLLNEESLIRRRKSKDRHEHRERTALVAC